MGPQSTKLVSGPASLLIALARRDFAGGERILDEAEFDTAELSRFTLHNQLAVFFHSQLGELPESPLITAEFVDTLSRYHRWQVKFCEQTRGAQTELVELLEGAGCSVLLLKGLYLASRFYGGLDRRTFWDLDLLTREADFESVERVLERAGFIRLSKALFGTSLSRRFVHGFDYQRGPCKIDLHWTLITHPAVRLDYERIWRDARRTDIAGTEARVLSDDMMIATNLLSAFEDLQRGSFRLRSFIDLYKILQTLEPATDWQSFFADRRQEGLRKISVSMLNLFMETFDAATEFPDLAAALAEETKSAGPVSLLPELMDGSALGLDNKRWAASHYEMSTAGQFGWWLVSLPFRLSVYQQDKIKRRLQKFGGKITWWRAAA